jgi:predicted DNA-binding transcriptional regulator AlpA
VPSVPPNLPGGRAVAWSSAAVLRWMRERVAASGGDPADIPDEPASLWRVDVVEDRTGLSRATIYRMATAGEFPRPVRLSVRPAERSPAPEAA